MIKGIVFCVAVTLIHCYYGYFVTGGPVGFGLASGRAVRASLVAIMVLDFITDGRCCGASDQLVLVSSKARWVRRCYYEVRSNPKRERSPSSGRP